MFARTERLLLRPGWPEDAPALFEAIADERVVRHLATAPWPYALADAETFLARERRASEAACVIVLRTSGAPTLIGGIGIHPTAQGERELGYWLAPPYWGRGFAAEAGRAMVGIARTLGLRRLVSGHFLDNPASGRVLEKIGFTTSGGVAQRFSAGRGAEVPCRLFELELAEEEEEEVLAA